jgi:hypothetical protein
MTIYGSGSDMILDMSSIRSSSQANALKAACRGLMHDLIGSMFACGRTIRMLSRLVYAIFIIKGLAAERMNPVLYMRDITIYLYRRCRVETSLAAALWLPANAIGTSTSQSQQPHKITALQRMQICKF